MAVGKAINRSLTFQRKCIGFSWRFICPASSALSFLLFTHGSFKRQETIQNNSALASDSAMAVTDDDRREYLRSNVTSDLQYVWDDAEIPLALQYEMAQHYKSLRVFTALGESSADVRTAVQADFNLDPSQRPSNAGTSSTSGCSLECRKRALHQRERDPGRE